MKNIVLQGTDGIRADVRLSTDKLVKGLSPVDAFLNKNILTEEFFEAYTYSVSQFFLKKKVIYSGDSVVLGYDPRDKEGVFIKKAVSGLRKAGLNVYDIGISPTPLVPTIMMKESIKCGIMITASHNPPDQNGIKVFQYPLGIKMLPEDDAVLSDIVINLNYDTLECMVESGEVLSKHEEALNSFETFLLDKKNSWFIEKGCLSKLSLIIDCANGSYSKFASRVFKKLGVGEIIELNNDLDSGLVNKNSGVCDFEDAVTISYDLYLKSSKYKSLKALKKLFELGRSKSGEILKKKAIVSLAVFDADGDRFYRLDYNPLSDSVIVLNGDKTASHQANFLSDLYPEKYNGSLYANTIESDISVTGFAKNKKFSTKLTAVGDKWILWWTAVSFLEFKLSLIKKHSTNFLDIVPKLSEMILKLSKLSDNRVSFLREIFSFIESSCDKNIEFKSTVKKAYEEMGNLGVSNFSVGSENSGHTITFGYLKDKNENYLPVFSGNGIKSAVNTFVSTNRLFCDLDIADYFNKLSDPFRKSYKKTYYTYYVDKDKMKTGSCLWNDLDTLLKSSLKKIFPDFLSRKIYFTDEPNLLYFGVYDDNDSLIASIYIRNSGTEDKTGLVTSGASDLKERLIDVGEEIFEFLLVNLKDFKKPKAGLEKNILLKISECRECSLNILNDLKQDDLDIYSILNVMENKQMLLRSKGDRYSLTGVGKFLVDNLKE